MEVPARALAAQSSTTHRGRAAIRATALRAMAGDERTGGDRPLVSRRRLASKGRDGRAHRAHGETVRQRRLPLPVDGAGAEWTCVSRVRPRGAAAMTFTALTPAQLDNLPDAKLRRYYKAAAKEIL